MTQPVCLNCCVTMYCHETGAFLEEMTSQAGYKIWCADIWCCPQCHTLTASGWGQRPFAEPTHEDYRMIRRQYHPRRFWSTPHDKEKYKEQRTPHPHLVTT